MAKTLTAVDVARAIARGMSANFIESERKIELEALSTMLTDLAMSLEMENEDEHDGDNKQMSKDADFLGDLADELDVYYLLRREG